MPEDTQALTAYHEAGHAIMAVAAELSMFRSIRPMMTG